MDDFYRNMNDFDSDAQLDIVDEEKLKVLDRIEEYTKLTKDAVKFQEYKEFDSNFRILASYISLLQDLSRLSDKEEVITDSDGNEVSRKLSDKEVYEKIKEIEEHVETITHEDLRDVETDDAPLSLDDIIPKNGGDDSSFDF